VRKRGKKETCDLPVDNGQCSVLVPLTDVSRSEPTVLRKDVFVRIEIWSVEVSLCDGIATDANLSLREMMLGLTRSVSVRLRAFRHFGGGEVTHIGAVEEFDLDGGGGKPDTAERFRADEVWGKERNHSAGFS